jgi:hypothetical protein
MKTLCKAITKLVTLGALAATPLFAQIPNGLSFTTSFPFYIGNQHMPAGSYIVTQPNMNSDDLLIRDADYARGVFFRYVPTETLTPVNQGEVSFREYGDVAFLDSITVTGDTIGMEALPSKHEKETALAKHEEASNNSVPLEAIRAGN